jgi:hypothetical protein
MEDSSRQDMRRLLKTFGIQADEALMGYLTQVPGDTPLQFRITLADVTAYEVRPLVKPLHLEIEGDIRRQP